MACTAASVSQFFSLASQSPFSQLQINWRERSSQFGDALVQCAIELQIRQRLQAGIIRLINNQVHQQVQVDLDPVEEAPQHPALPAAVRVRTLKVSPLPNNATCDEVRTALLEANIRVTAVRPLDNRSCEVSVDSSPEVDLMIARGFALRPNWYLRASDVMSKRHVKRGYPGRFSCFLCGSKDHVEIMCIKQKPRLACMVGA